MIALRYLHRKNKYVERDMLEARDRRYVDRLIEGCSSLNDQIDVEALKASLLMTDSYLKERVKL